MFMFYTPSSNSIFISVDINMCSEKSQDSKAYKTDDNKNLKHDFQGPQVREGA